ncbi:MAG: hypothetical protein ACI8TQ_001319 [Planctomycetota bacterium]|jgi:hypothetical protein
MRRGAKAALPAGASIPSLVRQAHHAARLGRIAEAGLIGIAAAALTLAAGLLSEANLYQLAPVSLALGVGLLVSATWLIGTHASLGQTARALDQRLNQSGALFTVFEAQQSNRDSELTRLLAARVASSVSPREALRVARPLDPIPLAAPFVAAAVLALTLDAIAPVPDAAKLGDFANVIAGEIANARRLSLETLEAGQSGDLGEQAAELPGELTTLLAKVSELKSKWGQAEADSVEALQAINQLRAEVEQTFQHLPPTTALSASIRALSSQLDAAAMRVGDTSGSESSAGKREAAERSLALSDAGGRITSAIEADGVSSANPATTLGGIERGAAVAIRWRPEYDEIVARWVESTRSVDEH